MGESSIRFISLISSLFHLGTASSWAYLGCGLWAVASSLSLGVNGMAEREVKIDLLYAFRDCALKAPFDCGVRCHTPDSLCRAYIEL